MNLNCNSGTEIRIPGIPQGQMGTMRSNPGSVFPGGANMRVTDRFPVGMGYVPMQQWETPYPMDRGFHRGTIFPALDYPFMMGRCR